MTHGCGKWWRFSTTARDVQVRRAAVLLGLVAHEGEDVTLLQAHSPVNAAPQRREQARAVHISQPCVHCLSHVHEAARADKVRGGHAAVQGSGGSEGREGGLVHTCMACAAWARARHALKGEIRRSRVQGGDEIRQQLSRRLQVHVSQGRVSQLRGVRLFLQVPQNAILDLACTVAAATGHLASQVLVNAAHSRNAILAA